MPLRNPGIRDTDRQERVQCRSTFECRASSCDEELSLVSAEPTRSFGDVEWSRECGTSQLSRQFAVAELRERVPSGRNLTAHR